MSIMARWLLIFSLMISMSYAASLLAAERKEEPKKSGQTKSDTIQSNDNKGGSEESAPVYDIEDTDFC